MTLLRIHHADGRTTQVPMTTADVVIGRAADCDVVLDDPLTSRRHARIYRDQNGRLWVEDLASKNGVTVNDEMARDAVQLKEADRVGIGSCYVTVHLSSPVSVVLDNEGTRYSTASIWSPAQQRQISHDRLERLYGLNERLSGRFNRDEFLREVIAACVEMLALERAGLALWAGDPTPPQWVALHNSRPDGSGEFRISSTLVERALHRMECILINDAAREIDPSASIISNHICSAMCVPLVYHDRVHGVLYGDRVTSTGGYAQDDLNFFAALGRQAAMGLANLQLLEEMQRRHHIEAQLQWARQIQNRLFPKEAFVRPGLCIDALNDPGLMVSGDYYDYLERPDGRITIVIADVSGKGVAAAMLMANLQAAVHVTLQEDDDVVRAIRRLNTLICQNVGSDRFITGLFGILDPAARTFSYINVGHPRPLQIWADGRVEPLPDLTSLPLGVDPVVDHELVVHDLGREPTTMFLYTDGVPDAENDRGEHLGEERLLNMLHNYAGDPPSELLRKLRRAIQQFTRSARQIDDITMIALRTE